MMSNRPIRSALVVAIVGLAAVWAAPAAASAAPTGLGCIKVSAAGQTNEICPEPPEMPVADSPLLPDVGDAFQEAVLGAEEQLAADLKNLDTQLGNSGVPANSASVLTTAGPVLEQVRTGLGSAISQVENTALLAVQQAPKYVESVDKQAGFVIDDAFEGAEFAADRLRSAIN